MDKRAEIIRNYNKLSRFYMLPKLKVKRLYILDRIKDLKNYEG